MSQQPAPIALAPAAAVEGTPQQLRGTYAAMDVARALAAATVVVSHARDLLMVDAQPGMGAGYRLFYAATGLGHQAVMIFFVLSGYWITRSVVGKAEGTSPFWPVYLADRLTRLWAVLLPALLLGGVLDAIGIALRLPIYTGITGAHSIPSTGIRLRTGDFLGNFAFLQMLVTPVFGSNGPLWSLAYEFWFYIWFPTLWLLVRFRKVSITVASLALMWLFPAMTFSFLSWLVGGAVFAIHHQAVRKGDRPFVGTVLTVAGALATILVLLASRVMATGGIGDVALAGAFGVLLLGALLRPLPFCNLLAPVARYGAGSSFSLYAVHFPILVLLAGGFENRFQPRVGAMMLVGLASALVVGVGWFFSLATEARTDDIRSHLRRRLTGKPARKRAATRQG